MLPYSSHDTTPMTVPQMMPLTKATPTSFFSRRPACVLVICPIAMARTIMVMVWLPELPPIPATMGISAALHEESYLDARPGYGRVVNNDFAGYHIAANADAPQVEARWIEPDGGEAEEARRGRSCAPT